WDLLCAAGLRFAEINQEYNAYVVGDSGSTQGPIFASVVSGHSFHGTGPVVALEARRPLLKSDLALYGSVRGAILFGSATQNALDHFIGFGTTQFTPAQDHRDRTLPVGEVELGLEYGRNMGSTRAIAQVALVGQEWWGAGNASRSTQANSFGI